MIIKEVLLGENYLKYLEDRKLIEQYKKTKKYILNGDFRKVNLKLREPKKDKIYYFRLNKQFRAFATLEGSSLKIFKIDNHQN